MGVGPAARMAWHRLIGYGGGPQIDESLVAYRCLAGQVTPGTMVDVGAHFGGSLAPFLRADWRVLAFEPDRRNRAALLSAFGDRPNLTVDARAVSESCESGVVLFRSPLSTGISGLSRFHSSHRPADLVDTITLAEALAEHRIRQVDFLKIDTEGFDLMALRGIDWHASAPTLVMCEFEDDKTVPLGYNYHDMTAFLAARGYQIIVSEWHPVKTYGERHQWRGFGCYPYELGHSSAWGNLLATRDAELAARLQQCLADMAREIAPAGQA